MDLNDRFAAIIIAYYPESSKFLKLIRSLSEQGCGNIVVYMNSELEDSLKLECKFCKFIGTGENLGLGRAINLSFEYLYDSFGDNLVVFTFDQDTEIANDFLENMQVSYHAIKNSEYQFSAVVPRVFDFRSDGYEYKLPQVSPNKHGFVFLKMALQSGMLIDYQTWACNKFNEELFIEYVDTEWCFRLRSYGKHIYQSSGSFIFHELSDDLPKNFLGMKLLKYSPLRRYYFYRNSFFMLRSKHVTTYYKFRILTAFVNRFFSIFIFEGPKIESIRMSIKGGLDGIRSKFGRFSI
ncbi:hypothetical protein [Stutzerimonas nitrititolerans]|uniref:hypothetical protein n=1 Tax=Stutzerimonas nitrititolerans TaxID=2482751 RepID=UPI0028A257B1|nr:hypothetical protein [Stutzerimonas nitrititolerans]